MNYYFVSDGQVKVSSTGSPPDTFSNPKTGQVVSNLYALETGDLAALGWLQGEPTEQPAYNPETQKCYIVPVVPQGVDEFPAQWRRYKGSIGAPPVAIPKVIEQWAVFDLTADELAAVRNVKLRELRWQRDSLLAATDRMFLSDAPEPREGRAAWAAYRESLRNLPASVTNPAHVTWPVAPNAPAPIDPFDQGQLTP